MHVYIYIYAYVDIYVYMCRCICIDSKVPCIDGACGTAIGTVPDSTTVYNI